jgi:hypothetical protein
LFLKKQIGGQRTVNIYDKANYRNLLFTIDLDDDDDIDILKYELGNNVYIRDKKNVKHNISKQQYIEIARYLLDRELIGSRDYPVITSAGLTAAIDR